MKYLIAGFAIGGIVGFAPMAHADPDSSGSSTSTPDNPSKTQEVCGGFNLGMSPSQIIGGLQKNDGRENYWQAWKDTTWPIIEGDCG